MRFKPDHNDKAKAAIVAAAGRRFRRDGYFGAGVDGVAADAGMTSGAVYSQFGSKKGLLSAVLRDGLEEVRRSFSSLIAGGEGAKALTVYFRPEHRADPAGGCLLPSLSADAARAGDEAQAVFAELLPAIVDEIEKGFPVESGDSRRDRAWAVLALMAGGMMLARALPEGATAQELLSACRRTALLSIDTGITSAVHTGKETEIPSTP